MKTNCMIVNIKDGCHECPLLDDEGNLPLCKLFDRSLDECYGRCEDCLDAYTTNRIAVFVVPLPNTK